MDFFRQSGVFRDTENGVNLYNAYVFQRGGKMGVTTHLYGQTDYDRWQVCSPIRTIEEFDDCYTFVTRSYNKYVIKKTEFAEVKESSAEFLELALMWWFAHDKCLRVLELPKDAEYVTLTAKEPVLVEKHLYGLK